MINKATINGVLGRGSLWVQGNKFYSGSVALTVPESVVGEMMAELYRENRSFLEDEIVTPAFTEFHAVNREELTRHFDKGAREVKGTRPALACVALYPDALVSADGYWLALSHVQGCDIPVLAPPEVKYFLKMAAGPLSVSVSGVNQCWKVGDWELRITVDATYPDYMQVIPQAKNGVTWGSLQMSWAKKLPKKDVSFAIIKLGGAWPAPYLGMSVAPAYLKLMAEFLGDSNVKVSMGCWTENAYEQEHYEEYATALTPLRLQGADRETICMPCHIMKENERFVEKRHYSTADPLIPGLYWA